MVIKEVAEVAPMVQTLKHLFASNEAIPACCQRYRGKVTDI